MKKNDDLSLVGLGCLLLLLITPVSIALNGWALATLWAWFIAPVFSVSNLSIANAIGIATVVNFIVPKPAKPKSEKEQATGEIIAQVLIEVFLNPLFAVLFGWIIYQFV
jgi:hypothetical protein